MNLRVRLQSNRFEYPIDQCFRNKKTFNTTEFGHSSAIQCLNMEWGLHPNNVSNGTILNMNYEKKNTFDSNTKHTLDEKISKTVDFINNAHYNVSAVIIFNFEFFPVIIEPNFSLHPIFIYLEVFRLLL